MPEPKQINATLDASGHRYALVVSRFNSLITKELLEGALDCLRAHGADPGEQTVIWAPGGFEIPLAVKGALDSGKYDGVIALGCVIKGSTDHNAYISSEVTKGIASLGLQYGKPVSFGVLTPNSLEQALERAGSKMGNKGAEAALAAIEMVNLLKLM